jgi:SAM-dependent methyltransferase
MVELARQRLRQRAVVMRANLEEPLNFLETESFDVIISALALDYVRDWSALFREFFRTLRAPGHFLFSAGHPFDDFYEHHPSACLTRCLRRAFGLSGSLSHSLCRSLPSRMQRITRS